MSNWCDECGKFTMKTPTLTDQGALCDSCLVLIEEIRRRNER